MDTSIIKENLRKYYNQEAAIRDKSEKQDWKIKFREDFCKLIIQENKNTLLELGAGAGYDSLFFMNNNLKVTAVDLSSEMVCKCKEKGIETYEMDFYNLSSLNKKFDSIWAMNTLLHVPKADLGYVLNEIDSVLNVNGLFYMGVYGGEDSEGEYVKSEISEFPRFFSFYSQKHIYNILINRFCIIDFQEINIGRDARTDIFQSILMRKKHTVCTIQEK